MRRGRNAATAVMAVTLCVVLSGCVGEQSDTVPVPMPVPTSTASISPSEAPAPAPEKDPTLLPGGTALANRAYFDFVNGGLLDVNSNPSSAAIVENLVNAGFPKSDLEVTPDKTAVRRTPADSIQFAVRTSKDCLVGQFQAGAYTSTIGSPVNGGGCLVGETETIP